MKVSGFTVVVAKDEDGVFIGRAPSLQGCHSYGHTLAELHENIAEAIQLCLEVQETDTEGDPEFVGAFRLEVAA